MDGLKININKALQIKFNRENLEGSILKNLKRSY